VTGVSDSQITTTHAVPRRPFAAIFASDHSFIDSGHVQTSVRSSTAPMERTGKRNRASPPPPPHDGRPHCGEWKGNRAENGRGGGDTTKQDGRSDIYSASGQRRTMTNRRQAPRLARARHQRHTSISHCTVAMETQRRQQQQQPPPRESHCRNTSLPFLTSARLFNQYRMPSNAVRNTPA